MYAKNKQIKISALIIALIDNCCWHSLVQVQHNAQLVGILVAGSLESVFWLLRGGHNILGHGGGEPLAVLW